MHRLWQTFMVQKLQFVIQYLHHILRQNALKHPMHISSTVLRLKKKTQWFPLGQ